MEESKKKQLWDDILKDYPDNIKNALLTHICNKGSHTTKYYLKGFIGVPEYLQTKHVLCGSTISAIYKKYYPNKGCFTYGINTETNRIFPMWEDKDGHHSFSEDMIANKEMWDEMAAAKNTEDTIEYAEELPLLIQYLNYKDEKLKRQKGENKSFWKKLIELIKEEFFENRRSKTKTK